MRRTYTVEELEELASMPESELEPAERRAVIRYRRSHAPVSVNDGTKPVAEPAVEKRASEREKAADSVAACGPVASVVQCPIEKPAALNVSGSVVPAAHTGLVEFIGDVLPDDAVVNHRPVPTWRWEAVELRTRPGVWALLAQRDSRSKATSLASAIRIGKLVSFSPQGLFEAEARTWPDGTHHVYARYVGEES
jgi:hypothetical protein